MTSTSRPNKTLCLPFPSEVVYQEEVQDVAKFRQRLANLYQAHPELFPVDFAAGYKYHDFVTSKKQALRQRRIKLTQTGAVYQIRPSFVMPYQIGRTADLEKPLYLLRWGVSFAALAYVFGHDAMFWYRAYVALGHNSVVGTTVKAPTKLPPDVLADEKVTRLGGKPAYIATTVAAGCLLGAEVVAAADTPALQAGYAVFQQEARALAPDYSPQTVNTDGWAATQNAWRALFPKINVILCFLHAFLKIKDSCRRAADQLQQIREKVWHVYHAQTVPEFAQRLRRLEEWAQTHLSGPVQAKVLALCAKGPQFKVAFDFPTAYRTSNALDRLMNYQDRRLYAMQYFHGTLASANLAARAMALIWNFHPYGATTQTKAPGSTPFERLNGFRYHDNWLENLQIAASLGGVPHHKIR